MAQVRSPPRTSSTSSGHTSPSSPTAGLASASAAGAAGAWARRGAGCGGPTRSTGRPRRRPAPRRRAAAALLELGVGLGLELRLGGRGGLRLGDRRGLRLGARATGRRGGRGGGSTGGPPSSAGGKRSSASSASRISASPIERASSRSRRRSAQTSSVSLSIRFRRASASRRISLRLALGLLDAGGGAGARAPRDLVRGLMGALQDRGGLLADAVELATDRGLGRARGVQLGDVLLERGQVGVDDLAVVAAEDHGELGPYPRRRVDRAAEQALGERVRVRGQPLGDRGVLHRLGGRRLLDGLLVDDRLLGRRRLELLIRLPLARASRSRAPQDRAVSGRE